MVWDISIVAIDANTTDGVLLQQIRDTLLQVVKLEALFGIFLNLPYKTKKSALAVGRHRQSRWREVGVI